MNDFTGYGESLHVSGCGCAECKIAQVERNMRAATCKCGQVGAECFNDSYCSEPASEVAWGNAKDHDCVLMNCKNVHRTQYEKALEDAAYWQDKYGKLNECFDEYRKMMQTENTAMLTAHKAELDQYLAQFAAWEELFTDLSSRIERAESTQTDKIAVLECESKIKAAGLKCLVMTWRFAI
jgi:hypothetical protein